MFNIDQNTTKSIEANWFRVNGPRFRISLFEELIFLASDPKSITYLFALNARSPERDTQWILRAPLPGKG